MNKETLSNKEVAKSVDSIDWLAEIDNLASFDMMPREFDGHEMREMKDGTYLRYGDVKQLLRRVLRANKPDSRAKGVG